MSPAEINRAIAESLGYRAVSSLECGLFWLETESGKVNGYKQGVSEDHAWAVCCPDYHGDLNACAEFEARIVDWVYYRLKLSRIIGTGWCPDLSIPEDIKAFLGATAPQRCEAYLKTIGKWRNE